MPSNRSILFRLYDWRIALNFLLTFGGGSLLLQALIEIGFGFFNGPIDWHSSGFGLLMSLVVYCGCVFAFLFMDALKSLRRNEEDKYKFSGIALLGPSVMAFIQVAFRVIAKLSELN